MVHDLARSVGWYTSVLGLHLMREDGDRAVLGDGVTGVLILQEDRKAAPRTRTAGIFHVALLSPSRAELARAIVRLGQAGAAIDGYSDHRTHEAVYLQDPDGIGLELAVDRPMSEWPEDWGYGSGPAPLDLRSLLGEIADEPVIPLVGEGLRVGHVHLTVNDIDAARDFYADGIGFGLTADLGTAVFFAAGEYHHHLATNIWRGSGIPPQPDRVVGLAEWTLELPDRAALAAVAARLASHVTLTNDGDALHGTDPAGIPFRAVIAAGSTPDGVSSAE